MVNRKRLRRTCARGKNLFLQFDSGTIHVHLGMQGKFFRVAPLRPPQLQVRLRLSSAEVAWDLIAPSHCKLLSTEEVEKIRLGLGPDPLDPDAAAEQVWEVLEPFSGPIGASLLNQSVVSGVGNVLRTECLFDAGISPARSAFEVSREEFDALWEYLRSRMRRAAKENRISVETPPGADGVGLPEAEARHVYKQANCRRCGAPVDVSAIGGRTGYACPKEQS